jgi:hypothetical protein
MSAARQCTLLIQFSDDDDRVEHNIMPLFVVQIRESMSQPGDRIALAAAC